MNIVVVGEGPSELGADWHKRAPLYPVSCGRSGALETLVRRVAKEVYDCDVQLVALPRLRPHQVGKSRDIALAEAIQDADYLSQLLVPSFSPAAANLQAYAAEAAVIACDKNLERQVANALKKVRPYLRGPVAHVVFDPEFEVLFFDKRAVEEAQGLSHCSLGPPPGDNDLRKRGQAKEPLTEWLRGHCNPDASFLKQVAKRLPLPGTRLAVNDFCKDVGGVFRHKKGPPEGDQIP